MCFKEFVQKLKEQKIVVTESQVRWAIRTGRVSRPRLDGSLRFDFSEDDVAEIVAYFQCKHTESHTESHDG